MSMAMKNQDEEETVCTCRSSYPDSVDSSNSTKSESLQDETKLTVNVQEILTECEDEILVPAEVLVQLLKIQSKYLDDHPCLCTSRFRHILHQLDHNEHKKLAELCKKLQQILLTSSKHLYETTRLYKSFMNKIFDVAGLLALRNTERTNSDTETEDMLMPKLEAIFARLVSDYRAIFAIEEQRDCQLKTQDKFKVIDHEHRKRHEEEDDCPEEIKLMKVAWAELSLECQLSQPSLPNQDKKDAKEGETSDDNANSQDESQGFATLFKERSKSKTPPSEKNSNQNQKTMVDRHHHHHHQHLPRKRKERNESYDQERKFSRSSSEVWDDSACDFDGCDQIKRCQSSKEFANYYDDSDSDEVKVDEIKAERANLKSTSIFYQCEEELSCSSKSNNHVEERKIVHPKKGRGKGKSGSGLNKQKSNNEHDVTSNVNNAEHIPLVSGDDEDSQSSCDSTVSTLSSTNGLSLNVPMNLEPRPMSTLAKKPLCPSLSLPESVMLAKLNATKDKIHEQQHQDESQTDSKKPEASEDPKVFVPTWKRQEENVGDSSTTLPYEQNIQPVSWKPSAHLSFMCNNDEEVQFSNRAFGYLHSQKYLDPDHITSQRRASDPEILRRSRLKNLKKQLNVVRRKLECLEIDFESSQGYKPSYNDKQSDVNMRKLLHEQSHLKRQIRSHRNHQDSFDENTDDTASTGTGATDEDSRGTFTDCVDNNNANESRDLESMRNTMLDIEAQLKAKRKLKGRPTQLEEMTTEQLQAEKLDIQSSLLQFEEIFGHPESPEEKELMKNIYDRYRHVKRLIRRSSNSRSKDQQELETIPEDEALPLTLASPPHRINLEVTLEDSNEEIAESSVELKGTVKVKKRTETFVRCKEAMSVSHNGQQDNASASEEQNLHSMSRYELLQMLRKLRDEKRMYRRKVKEKEEIFFQENGRRLLKEDRDHSENVYQLYKNAKAKIKLIDALLSKSTITMF